MTAPALGAYTFLPWVQRGLGRAIAAADEPGAALAARVSLPITMHVDGAGDVATSARLYGPGDVTGLDPAQIVRHDPLPGTTRFESGYLPQVQFSRADLPWLFTPAAPASARTRLRPWLVLVTIRRQDGVRVIAGPGGPLPVLEITAPANAAAELPDLAQSWAWAHAQIAGLGAGLRPADVLSSDPGRACSRLVCPRRLLPGTAYLACVVPAFRAGVKTGLGEPLLPADQAHLEPAWGPTPPSQLRLPVYHSWEFATGSEGSFETLVRRLHPSPLDPSAAQPPMLDLTAPGGGLPNFPPVAAGAVTGLESALRVPGPDTPPPWPDATRLPFQAALEKLITTASPDVLTAPVYGQLQAGTQVLPPDGSPPAWLRELNLDPRLRVAAAAGTRVVQDRQEQLMARAWEQAGAISDANSLLRRAQLARELGTVVLERHLEPLPASDLLAITQPAHTQISLSQGSLTATTVDAELRASRVPQPAVSGALRRLASPQGVLARRAVSGSQPQPPIDVLAAADQVAMSPPAAAPPGMVSMASVAAVAATSAVTAAAAAVVQRVDTRKALSPDALRLPLLASLAPEVTTLARAQEQVEAPGPTWTRPDPLAPVRTGPRFDEPMYADLQRVAPALLLPPAAVAQADGVALLETTPRVIEAYLVGLNHELSRELLWREYPASLGTTAFRQFWDVSGQAGDPDTLADIPPISEWDPAPLGGHLRRAGGQLVLLVRGELLRRYPVTTIYAARATASGALDPATRLAPAFRATISPDIALLGFALTHAAALGLEPAGPGWYFVFEEYPGEPRFGFDEVAGPGIPKTPDDLAWAHVPLTDSGHVDISRPLLSAAPNLQAIWGREAAGLATLTFQRPFRVGMHAARLLPGATGADHG